MTLGAATGRLLDGGTDPDDLWHVAEVLSSLGLLDLDTVTPLLRRLDMYVVGGYTGASGRAVS